MELAEHLHQLLRLDRVKKLVHPRRSAKSIHLDAPINTVASESRASLSWNGLTMVFGSTRPGSELAPDGVTISTDVYVVTREAG